MAYVGVAKPYIAKLVNEKTKNMRMVLSAGRQ